VSDLILGRLRILLDICSSPSEGIWSVGRNLTARFQKQGKGSFMKTGIRSHWAAILLALCLAALSASATTRTVTSTNDSGTGTLRDTIAASISGDTIVFDPSVTNTITLTSGELAIGRSLTITGPGATNLTVSGNGVSRVFNITAGSVNISGLAVSGGLSLGTNAVASGGGGPAGFGFGGGIYNQSTLTLSNCTVSGSLAKGGTGGGFFNGGPGQGGGIYNQGTLRLAACTLSSNTASGGNPNVSGTSNGAEADGGGVYNGGTLVLVACTLSGNSASGGSPQSNGSGGSGYGGGLYSASGVTLTMTNCTLGANSATGTAAGGGSGAAGGNGSGGGVYNQGTLGLTACTVSANSATGGGGGSNSGTGGDGGNGAGGGLGQASGSVTVLNTIIAGNTGTGGAGGSGSPSGSAGTAAPDVSGAVTTSGYDLIGKTNGSSGWGASDLTGTAVAPLNPGLSPLANNGGPTPTMAAGTGSPAIDKGNSFGLTTDQRGQLRPFDNPNISNAAGGDGSDIGAYENQSTVGFTNIVLNTNDSGAGSLRQAIAVALSGDIITFDPSVTNTIGLISGELAIGRSLTITGPGATNLAVSGNGVSRVFNITAGSVNISGLAVSGGLSLGTKRLSGNKCRIYGRSFGRIV
jgi:hypothetical protein